MKTGTFAAGEYTIGVTVRKPVLHFVHPVLDADGKVKLLIVAAIDLARYGELFPGSKLPKGSILGLLDRKGIRLYRYPEPEKYVGGPLLPVNMRGMSGGESEGVFRAVGSDGVDRLSAYKKFYLEKDQPPYMFMLAGIPEKDALSYTRRVMYVGMILLVIALMAAIMLAWLVGKKIIVKRLEKLVRVSRDLGQGDLQARTDLKYNEDELGQLAKSFDEMAGSLENKEIELNHSLKALQSSEGFLSTIIENSPHAMWISDDKGTIIRTNQALRDLLHVADDEIVDNYNVLKDNVVEEQGLMPLLKQAFEKGVPVKFATPYDSSRLTGLKLSETAALFLDLSISPVINAKGRITNVIAQITDVTEHKRAEEALRESEERYRSIFENSPLGIFQSTFEGTFIRVNPTLARTMGYESPRDAIDSISDMAAQIYANPQERAEVLHRMRENGGQVICENEYLRKDGRKWVGHLTMNVINDDNGNPHHLDGIVEDVTEKKTMEEKLDYTMEQLRTLSHRLLEIQETERRYIARELHDEIGQILTALRINLKRTERSRITEPALAAIHESTAMVEELINQVRNLSIELRPSVLDDFGLTAALEWYIGWLSMKAEFKVLFHTDFTDERLSHSRTDMFSDRSGSANERGPALQREECVC